MKSFTSVSAPVVLGIVCFGVFTTALDQTAVVTALPTMMPDLKIPTTAEGLDRASWIVTAYLLAYTSAMPIMGRLADIHGHSKVYKASLVVFGIGSTLVAVATNLEWMVGARVVQAIGGGATVPISMAIACAVLPNHQRGVGIGLVIASAEAGSMLGPAYGGAIVKLLDWRWVFWLNLPQSAVLFLALTRLPSERQTGVRMDYLGGALLTATLVLLSLTLSQGGLFSLSSPAPLIIGIPAIGIAVSFILLERRTIQPLLAGFLFQSRAFLAANLTQLLEGISFIIAIVTVPLMADTVMGKDPLTGALWLLRLTVFIPVGAILGGLLLSFTGVRPVTIAGLGFGLNNAPIMTRALGSVSQDYRATVASLVTVSRMIGMALGLAALTGWGVQEFQGLTAGLELPLPLEGETEQTLQARMDTYNTGLVDAGLSLFNKFFRVAGLVSLVAILPALLTRASRREQEETEKEEEKGAT